MRVYTIGIYLDDATTPVWRKLCIDPRWDFNALAETLALSLQVDFSDFEFIVEEEKVRITNHKDLLAQAAFLKSDAGKAYLAEAQEREFEVDTTTRVEDASTTPIVRYLEEGKSLRYLPHIKEPWCYTLRLDGTTEGTIALLEGQGTAPQRYFGDQAGQDLLWQVLTDPSHPEYHALRTWLDQEGVHLFDLDDARDQVAKRWQSQ